MNFLFIIFVFCEVRKFGVVVNMLLLISFIFSVFCRFLILVVICVSVVLLLFKVVILLDEFLMVLSVFVIFVVYVFCVWFLWGDVLRFLVSLLLIGR